MADSRPGKLILWESKKRAESGELQPYMKVLFKLHGQHIHSIRPIHPYDVNDPGDRGELMADVGRALYEHNRDRLIVDIKYRFAPTALANCSSKEDLQLQRCGLVLLDFKGLTGRKPYCPLCGLLQQQQQDAGFPDNARSCKGDGEVHTWFLLAKRRKCVNCPGQPRPYETKSFMDSDPAVVRQLPPQLAQLMPIVISDSEVDAAAVLMKLLGAPTTNDPEAPTQHDADASPNPAAANVSGHKRASPAPKPQDIPTRQSPDSPNPSSEAQAKRAKLDHPNAAADATVPTGTQPAIGDDDGQPTEDAPQYDVSNVPDECQDDAHDVPSGTTLVHNTWSRGQPPPRGAKQEVADTSPPPSPNHTPSLTPVITSAEVQLFLDLRPHFTRDGQVDFARMTATWNRVYAQQLKAGVPSDPDMTLYSKNASRLMEYHQRLDRGARAITNYMYMVPGAARPVNVPAATVAACATTVATAPATAATASAAAAAAVAASLPLPGRARTTTTGAAAATGAALSVTPVVRSGYNCKGCAYFEGVLVPLKGHHCPHYGRKILVPRMERMGAQELLGKGMSEL